MISLYELPYEYMRNFPNISKALIDIRTKGSYLYIDNKDRDFLRHLFSTEYDYFECVKTFNRPDIQEQLFMIEQTISFNLEKYSKIATERTDSDTGVIKMVPKEVPKIKLNRFSYLDLED